MRAVLALTAVVLAVLLAGCGGSGSGTTAAAADTAPADTTPADTTPAETSGGTGSSDAFMDPCSLLSEDDLGAVFSTVPEPEPNVLGAGFGVCEWQSDEGYVAVTFVPAPNLQSDYIDQLNLGGNVESDVLPDGTVSFPGIVSIGAASGGGSTVAFVGNGAGVMVAARNGEGDDQAADLGAATALAEAVYDNL